MNTFDLFEKLKKEGFIDYGSIIPIKTLEELIKLKWDDGWPFLGPYLGLRQMIQDEGYFLRSQRNSGDNSIHILNAEEMVYECDRRFKKAIKEMKRTAERMGRADVSELNDLEIAKHAHSTNKIIIGLNAMKSSISRI